MPELPEVEIVRRNLERWTAGRVALLMENAAYFAALREALENARESVLLLGWQFDPRTRLDLGEALVLSPA